MTATAQNTSHLAIHGGPKVREKPFPQRHLFGENEKAAAMKLFDECIATGVAFGIDGFGYNGKDEEAYCREFAEFHGGGYADGVSSGTAAVYTAVRALDLEPYSEVVVSPITDPGGMMPIALAGCIPIVADTAPGRYNVGPEQIEAVLTERTSAICVSHIGGEPVDVETIAAIAKARGVRLIEDCSQSHAAELHGKRVGTFGDVAAFSTMCGKHHATGGQGGVVFTRDEKIHWRGRQMADRGKPYGIETCNGNVVASLNLNLNDLAAAIGRVQLNKLPWIVDQRRAIVEALRKPISQLKTISIPTQLPGATPSYWWLRMKMHLDAMTCTREEYTNALAAEGIQLHAKYAYMPHRMTWFKEKNVLGNTGWPWSSP